MQDIKFQIEAQLIKILQDLEVNDLDPKLEIPKDQSHGDYSSNIAMQLSKVLKKNPMEIAQDLVSKLSASSISFVDKVEVAKPGFINFFVNDNYYKAVLEIINSQKDKFGSNQSLKGKRIMIEFAHPNPFKSFHIGHLRNIILGESLVRLIEARGAEVIRVNYQGDVGMHIAKCLWAFKKVDPKDYPESADEKVAMLGKCYSEGATAFEEEPEIQTEIKEINKKIYSKEDQEINNLWDLGKKWSLEKFHEIYERVGSTFIREYMESEVLDKCMEYINEALEKGILKKSDGAVIFDGSPYGLNTRVFLNSEGLPTYEGKELGLAYKEFTDYGNIDLCIHNVAVEQISFFKVTFKVEELLDPVLFKGKQYHNAYEFVGLKSGKMSSRKGQVVLGNDILNQAHDSIKNIITEKNSSVEDIDAVSEKVGIAAIKYSFLKISPFTYLAFDLNESVSFEGESGPYLMYTYTRAKSVLSQANSFKITNWDNVLNFEEEIALIKQLARFPNAVEDAGLNYMPNTLALYLYDLAQKFNKFYNSQQILKAENEDLRNSRLQLTAATAQVLKNGLQLLGIETVERM